MWGFAWMFWLMPFLFFALATRRRRSMGRGWYGPFIGPPVGPYAGRWAGDSGRAVPPGHAPDAPRADDGYIDALESRVARLEERLDFTERLLAGRGEKGTSP